MVVSLSEAVVNVTARAFALLGCLSWFLALVLPREFAFSETLWRRFGISEYASQKHMRHRYLRFPIGAGLQLSGTWGGARISAMAIARVGASSSHLSAPLVPTTRMACRTHPSPLSKLC